ncbi:bacterioferritin-associated ferredoxin [Rhizobacter sp. Root1221]|uniref:(2Fe-2S)-binding protein n=1 Tax=Rhizobacter sp. Root1221 TaxID=1736433 RepID=UPI0006FAB0C7|nr:(2Fe-2S)-binding protein [Rhizobacter sp. Root1221]KQW00611.1 (2Fe-2S)-binding protein [Rhizobacter sp. Root1221]
MIVCVCRRVSDRDIERHARGGCASFDDLQMDTGVATCCGNCTDCARDVFDSARNGTAPAHYLPIRIQLAA